MTLRHFQDSVLAVAVESSPLDRGVRRVCLASPVEQDGFALVTDLKRPAPMGEGQANYKRAELIMGPWRVDMRIELPQWCRVELERFSRMSRPKRPY